MNFEQCVNHPSFAAIFAVKKPIAALILKSRLDSNSIAGHINTVFTHMFGTFPRHYSFADCIPVAHEIIESILAKGYSVDYFPVE